MHEKQILMQEWICMKCPHKSNVEGDQYFNSRSTCMSLLRHGCQRHSFLNSQTGSQMYTFPDQMNWQFVQILIHFKFQSKLRVLDTDDVKQKTSFFSVRDNLLAMFSWFFVFLFYVSSVSVTQNKCPNSHHSHPVHLFNTWISRECKLQNGWIS